MSGTLIRVIDVYPYRFTADREVEYLLLRRAEETLYAGQWRMIGGKIGAGEAAWQAALREVREEVGQEPVQMWSLPSVNAFYEWQHDRVNLAPAFAAELAADPILNDEHDSFVWLAIEEAAQRLTWPEQERLLRLTHRLLSDGLPPELVLSY